MDRDYLKDYLDQEIDHCRRVCTKELHPPDEPRDKLRKLYGVAPDRHVVYCESGGIENLDHFPQDTLIVLSVFPHENLETFEKCFGPFDKFMGHCHEGRIQPVLQLPTYYEGMDHLEPLFREVRPPSYFCRGPFCYATLLNMPPDIVFTHTNGSPVLAKVNEYILDCESRQSKWLQKALEDPKCWEHKYLDINISLQDKRARLVESLAYRYASVALCIGQDPADEILNAFDYLTASRILLHLHILFDHVIGNGFGSSISLDPSSKGGRDYMISKTNVLRWMEHNLCQDLKMLIPRKPDEALAEDLRHEHPLREIRLDSLKLKDLKDIGRRIERQFMEYNRKVERLERTRGVLRKTFQITLLLLSAILMDQHALAALPTGLAGANLKTLEVPDWLSDATINAFRRIYTHDLGCYLVGGASESGVHIPTKSPLCL